MSTGLDQIRGLIPEDRRPKNSLAKLEYLLLDIKNEINLKAQKVSYDNECMVVL